MSAYRTLFKIAQYFIYHFDIYLNVIILADMNKQIVILQQVKNQVLIITFKLFKYSGNAARFFKKIDNLALASQQVVII